MSSDSVVLRGTMRGHTDQVTAIATPMDNSDMIVTASRDKSIIHWHLTKDDKNFGVPRRRLNGHSHFVQDVVLSSDGQFALSGSWDGELRLWDLANGVSARRFVGHKKDVLSVAFSIDNRQIVSASRDRTIKLWNTLGECKYTIEGPEGHSEWVSCVRFSPNNLQPTIVSASWDRTVKVWNLTNCKLRNTLAGHGGYVNSVAVSPDGSLCASGGKDGVILLWDLAEGKRLYNLDAGSVIHSLCFSPNRYWLCAATESSIKIWDLESKSIVEDLKVDLKAEAEKSDGSTAATTISKKKSISCRWYNFGDPLINKSKWTDEEGKKLRSIVEDKGLHNWPDIAASLGTCRTPFQCLARYQRTYNCLMLNSEWTEEEDAQLCEAVEIHGESDWQAVASRLKGRTGNQCSNRWKKSLDPSKPRKGRWTLEEDKRLKIAVQFFGTNDWNKIAQFVPGRTGPRCCERWSNCLDPSKKFDDWTEEEDLKLGAAFEKHGIQWAKIAKECLPHRTDNACRRRCKVLYPDEVALLEDAKKNDVYPSNFVDRESERPTSYKKVILPSTVGLLRGPKRVSKPRNHKTKSRSKKSLKTALVTIEENGDNTAGNTVCSTKIRTKRSSKKSIPKQQLKSVEIAEKDRKQDLMLVPVGSLDLVLKEDDFVETVGGDGNAFSKRNDSRHSGISEGAPEMSNPVSLGIHFDESELLGGHLDSNLPSINGEEVLHGSPLPREGMFFEPQLSRKTSTDVASNGDCLALTFPANMELTTISSEGVEKASFDDSGQERKAFKPSSKRKRIAEPTGHSARATFVRCQQDANKKPKCKAKFSSNQASKLVNEEDVPLVVFLQKKSKRKLEEFQDSERVCSPNMNSRPEFFSTDQPDNGSKILPLLDEAQICSGGCSEGISYCEEHQKQMRSNTTYDKEPCLANAFKHSSRRKRIGKLNGDSGHGASVPCNGVKKLKHRAKLSSNQVLKLTDEEDVPLAVSFGNKLKKRRQGEYRNNNQVCSANMNSEYEFFSGIDNGHPQTWSNEISEKIPYCEECQKHMQSIRVMDDEACVADAVNGRMVASQESTVEQISVTVGAHPNAKDVPFATYSRRKRKERS